MARVLLITDNASERLRGARSMNIDLNEWLDEQAREWQPENDGILEDDYNG